MKAFLARQSRAHPRRVALFPRAMRVKCGGWLQNILHTGRSTCQASDTRDCLRNSHLYPSSESAEVGGLSIVSERQIYRRDFYRRTRTLPWQIAVASLYQRSILRTAFSRHHLHSRPITRKAPNNSCDSEETLPPNGVSRWINE
jgi:hypothetical protein